MVELSVVIPVYNELACLDGLCASLYGVLSRFDQTSEVLIVDDGSTDGTWNRLEALSRKYPTLRPMRLTPNSGQSAALGAGFKAARGTVIVTMDGDGQNDPEDIPRLVAELDGCDMCGGYRAERKDSPARRIASRLANFIRNRALGESIIDTGCTLKAVKAEFLRDLPMFHGMHRFLPALAKMQGASIRQIPVNHHPRQAGTSKYTNAGRLKTVVADLFAVRWMKKRHRNFQVTEGG